MSTHGEAEYDRSGQNRLPKAAISLRCPFESNKMRKIIRVDQTRLIERATAVYNEVCGQDAEVVESRGGKRD